MSRTRRPAPDQDQRDLVLDYLDRNMLVEAAAGTGKTTCITGRMVALLASGRCADVRTMAAVTFTRKAAAELRARFQVTLERAVRDAAGVERERLARALDNIEQCFIGTIHSFCGRLLRERPVEAGIDLAFEEIDEAADALLRQETWNEYCAWLLAGGNEETLAELDRLGMSPSDLGGAFDNFAAYPDVAHWPVGEPRDLDSLVEQAAHAVEQYTAHMAGLAPRLPRACGSDKLIGRYRGIPRVLSHYDDLRDPRQLAEVLEGWFDKASGETQKVWASEGNFTKQDAKAEGQRWNEFRESVVAPFLRAMREARYGLALDILAGARKLYDARRAERGQLNFQDLLLKAAGLLRDRSHVRRYFGARFTHLLVDEFQDTDPIQAEVMMLLTATDPGERNWRRCRPRPGSLFVVGDPKQSIYRFRRADIVTYNEVKQIILSGEGDGRGLMVSLSANFRAVEPLIEWVNEVFEPRPAGAGNGDQGVMLRFEAAASEESPSYVPLSKGRREGSDGKLSGVFQLFVPQEAGTRDAATAYEADLIARFIRNAIDSGVTVSRTEEQLAAGITPAVTASDFMIITWATRQLSTYARKLQEYGIPHRVTGGTALNEVEELRHLRTCLDAVARPDNPVPLVAALRSELFGLSDSALFRFKAAAGQFNYNSSVPASLEPADFEAFEDTFERLKKYHLWLSRLPAVSAVESIVADLGLAVLASSRQGGDVQAGSLGKAMELLRGIQRGTWAAEHLVEFLDGILDPDTTQKYDGISARSHEVGMVRVMNLHKVKGLESPVVFLASAYGEWKFPVELSVDRMGEEVAGNMAVFRVGVGRSPKGPLLAHPEGWYQLAEGEERFAAAEGLRLRYVAATRAGSALIITERPTGQCSRNNAWKHFAPYLPAGALLEDPGEQEAPTLEKLTITAKEAANASRDIAGRLARAETPTHDVRAAKEYALSEPALAPEAGDRSEARAAEADREPTPLPGRGEHGVEWGQAIHQLLELAMASPETDLLFWAGTLLEENGIVASRAPAAAETVRSVMSSDIWARARASDRRMTEVPFHVALDDTTLPTIIRGAIDLVFAEPGGWVLVDFKTDTVGATGEVDALTTRYAPQLWLYARAWELCTREKVSEAGLYFVRVDRFVVVDL